MRGTGRDRGFDHAFDLARPIGDPRQDRCDQHASGDTGVVEGLHSIHPRARAGRPGLGRSPNVLVHGPDREGGRDGCDGRRFRQQVDVAQDERAFGEDGEWIPARDEGAQDAAHQAVPTFDPLVGVRPRPHRDVFPLPPPRCELASKDLRCIDLHHDLRLEVAAGIHIQIGVGRSREAVHARVGAASVGVDRPVERHPAGHLVDHRAGFHLDARDPTELGRVEGATTQLEHLFGHLGGQP